ncbi:MAG TPA: hypothetical protein VLJ14_06500 [Ktedonobacterales bacterium]|nr:hypothetical protein [Ktedonobacterales bacterium]
MGAGAGTEPRGPAGIGTAVAFDWALAAQIVIVGLSVLVGAGPGSLGAGRPIALRVLAAVLSVALAALPFALGEAMRRGRQMAWVVQLVFNSLLPLTGLVQIPAAIDALGHGQFGLLVREVVVLLVSPLIVWLLTRPRTRAWLARTTSAEARARHGSARWLVSIAVIALLGGAAIAFDGLY